VKRSYGTYAASALILVGIGTLAVGAGTAQSSARETIIKVDGTSSISVTPTVAVINVGVTNSALTAEAALSANSRTMQNISSVVRHLGVKSSAMATNNLGINPQYNQSNQLTGYQVSDALSITAPTKKTGAILDAAVRAGANQVNGVSFTTPGNALYRTVYLAALKNATLQADALAAGLHEHVLGVSSITVQNAAAISPLPLAMATSAVNTPIYAGQQQESITLAVVYRVGS